MAFANSPWVVQVCLFIFIGVSTTNADLFGSPQPCLCVSVVLCLPRRALPLHGDGVHARRGPGQPHQHLRRAREMGQVLRRRGGDGSGFHSLHGLHPPRRQAGQHAAGPTRTPEAGRLRHLHEDGLCESNEIISGAHLEV